MQLVKRDNTQTLPYELIELVMKHLSRRVLVKLYIQSTKYNPKFSQHIGIVIQQLESPLRQYINIVYSQISLISTRIQYVNTISNFHNIKLRDNKEKENIIYKNFLAKTIANDRERKKFENLTGCIGKYYE